MADLAGSPQELIDPNDGRVTGQTRQTLYGVRSWDGSDKTPLLFTGQYFDDESGWAYNRYRYYHPHGGIYNAQDPLGVRPRISSAQGFVDHAAYLFDPFGLEHHQVKKPFAGKTTSGPAGDIQMKPYSGDGRRGGHHTPMKAFINGADNAQALQNAAPCVPLEELEKLGTLDKFKVDGKPMSANEIHQRITSNQRQELARILNDPNGSITTWDDVAAFEIAAHTNAGVPESYATAWVNEGIQFLTDNGVPAPTHFPWNGPLS